MDRMYDFLNTTIFKPKDYYNSVYETYDQPYLNTSNGYLCKNYELDPPCEDIEKLRSSLTALSYNELKDEFMNFTPGLYEIMLADFSSDESETLNGVTD